jgi:hypothetical protein
MKESGQQGNSNIQRRTTDYKTEQSESPLTTAFNLDGPPADETDLPI